MLDLSARRQELKVHVERSKTEEALMAFEAQVTDDVTLIATPDPDRQGGSWSQCRNHGGQSIRNVIRRQMHQRAHRPSGIKACLPKGRRVDGALDDGDTPLGGEQRVGVGQVESDVVEARSDKRFTISARSSTEVDDRPAALCLEEAHELVSQFHPAT